MNLPSPLAADPVEAKRAAWQPARLMLGETLLADVEYDDEAGMWIAHIYAPGTMYTRIFETFDTFAEAVAWADGWLKKKGLR